MKVTAEHLAQIREAIEATGYDNEEIRQRYRDRRIPRGDKVQDIDKRFRWDLYYAAGAKREGGLPDSTDGYTMDHIDTALRSIVRPL